MKRILRRPIALAAASLLVACGDNEAPAGTSGEPDTTTSSTTTTGTSTTGTSPTTGTVDPTTTTGDTSTTDIASTSTGPAATCGNGELEPPEACDDGNADNTDACLDTCVEATCGDGFVGPGEACDDGNAVDADACSNACALASCGDGVVQDGEQCDDGDADDGDACLTTCLAAVCGDLVVQTGVEQCDDGDADDTDDCPTNCKQAACGDGFVWTAMEDCDAGGEAADCDADCTYVVCGDQHVNAAAGETCDDGNDSDNDACRADCKLAACGDGVVHVGVEQCDDGNQTAGDGCSAACQIEPCTFDVSKLPKLVHEGSAYGEIAFDGQCNVLVTAAGEDGLFRVNRVTGAVTKVVDTFDADATVGVVYRHSDATIYVAVDTPRRLYAVTGNFPALVVPLTPRVMALAVAPPGFGKYGDQIFGVTDEGEVIAVDTASKKITTVATSDWVFTDLAFAPDDTLYVVDDATSSIKTVKPNGVFAPFLGGLVGPDGIAIDSDGSRLFVSHYPNNSGRLDIVSIPGAVLSEGPAFYFTVGTYTTGLLVDAAGHVLVKSKVADTAALSSFTPP